MYVEGILGSQEWPALSLVTACPLMGCSQSGSNSNFLSNDMSRIANCHFRWQSARAVAMPSFFPGFQDSLSELSGVIVPTHACIFAITRCTGSSLVIIQNRCSQWFFGLTHSSRVPQINFCVHALRRAFKVRFLREHQTRRHIHLVYVPCIIKELAGVQRWRLSEEGAGLFLIF
jgi:hypothetical protein